jgi:hypothetical protein
LPEAYRPHARCQVVRLRLWSPSTTRVRSQLFLWYASPTEPVGPTRVVMDFRRGGRDLFWGALCLRVRLTRVVRLYVARVCLGLAGLTHAGQWGAHCLRLVGLTRVVRLFGFDFGRRAPRGCEASSFIVRVSYGACRPHACRYGFPQRRERPLLGCALSEGTPHARCQVVCGTRFAWGSQA